MTEEIKVRIHGEQINFVRNFAQYGFHDFDEMIRRALDLLKHELELVRRLEASADLYTEVYASDEETKEWIEDSVQDWP